MRNSLLFRGIFLVFLFCSFLWVEKCIGQTSILLTSEVKAYLFHVVRKSPILDKNIGYAFEYSGPKVTMKGGAINYDSIDIILLNQPELLFIRTDELANSPKGLLLELCNKTAVWMLNKSLFGLQNGNSDVQKNVYQYYIQQFFDNLPKAVMRSKNFEGLTDPKISPILHGNYSLYDRCQLLGQLGFIDPRDQERILDAQSLAINNTTAHFCLQLFQNLGGKANDFDNFLFAAGDGSYTDGLLSERERDDEGNWNKGLPKAIGLFPYDLKVVDNEVRPERMVVRQLTTCGNGLKTNLHFDVWGYNTQKQTTVVVEKNGVVYQLFGSDKTRFLSPDTSFSKGYTFQRVINELERHINKDIVPKLKGKNGFNNQIEPLENRRNQIYYKIQTIENEINESSKESANVFTKFFARLFKSRVEKRSRIRKLQQETSLKELYEEYNEIELELKDLYAERDPIWEEFTVKNNLLNEYRKQLGINRMGYETQNGIYYFNDSVQFNQNTQEFIFPASYKKEPFEIRLIAIPDDYVGESADEVMVHVSKIDLPDNVKAALSVEFFDSFESDGTALNRSIFQDKDSVMLNRFFTLFSQQNPIFIFEINGNGIGKLVNGNLQRCADQTELKNYPGSTPAEWKAARDSDEFASLRKTTLFMKIDKQITVQIESFTDPVVSHVAIRPGSRLNDLLNEGKITRNEALSVLRSMSVLQALKLELNVLASKYLPSEKAKRLIDSMNSSIDKTRVKVGNEFLRLKDI
ncbi:MAG: hypothetical protein RL264_2170 [Bacteroidota bacterium]